METETYKNVTLYINGSVFGITTIHCRSLTVTHRPYAQYDRATELRWKAPRQRVERGTVLAYNQAMVIVDGLTAAKFDNFEPSDGMSARGLFSACDSRWNGAMIEHARSAGTIVYSQDSDGIASL